MKTNFIALAVLASSLAFVGNAAAQDTTDTPSDTTDVAIVDREIDPALRDLIQEFRDQRQDVLQLLRELRARLANATEEERRAIIAEFRLEVRERNQAERELRKELRKRRLELIRERRQIRAGQGD